MKLSFSSNAFVRFSIHEAIREIAETGYSGIELLADAPHLYADNLSPQTLEAVAKSLARSGLSVSNVNANTAVGWYGRSFWEPLFEPSLANPDADLRKWRVQYTRKCIDIANLLGAKCVSVTSGKPVSGTYPEKSRIMLVDSLQQVVEYAEKMGVLVCVEYEPGLLIESCDELAELLEQVNSPFLGANLDVGHSHVLGEKADSVIEKLGPRIFHVHLEDIRGKKHFHRIPGTGDIGFDSIFAALTKAGYDGYLCVELYTHLNDPVGAAKASLDYLKPFIDTDCQELQNNQ